MQFFDILSQIYKSPLTRAWIVQFTFTGMNKSLKWVLIAVIISVSLVVTDQNLNGVENPGADFSHIKMINLGATIIFISAVIAVILLKYSRKGKG